MKLKELYKLLLLMVLDQKHKVFIEGFKDMLWICLPDTLKIFIYLTSQVIFRWLLLVFLISSPQSRDRDTCRLKLSPESVFQLVGLLTIVSCQSSTQHLITPPLCVLWQFVHFGSVRLSLFPQVIRLIGTSRARQQHYFF